MATLVTFPLPTGLRGHVDDVVVDQAARGRGIARKLLDTITLLAHTRQLRTLDLSSRPSRAAAIQLYESVGFQRGIFSDAIHTASAIRGRSVGLHLTIRSVEQAD